MKRSGGTPRRPFQKDGASDANRYATVKGVGLGAVAALTIGLMGIAGPASAAPPTSNSAPVATITAVEPVGNTVTVRYTINRAAKQISQPVCTLDTFTTVGCGDQTGPSTKKLTTYSTTLTGLESGDHAFAVTFTLTDGGSATATALFTTDAPSLLEQECNRLGGILAVGGPYRWRVTPTPSAPSALGLRATRWRPTARGEFVGTLSIEPGLPYATTIYVTCYFA